MTSWRSQVRSLHRPPPYSTFGRQRGEGQRPIVPICVQWRNRRIRLAAKDTSLSRRRSPVRIRYALPGKGCSSHKRLQPFCLGLSATELMLSVVPSEQTTSRPLPNTPMPLLGAQLTYTTSSSTAPIETVITCAYKPMIMELNVSIGSRRIILLSSTPAFRDRDCHAQGCPRGCRPSRERAPAYETSTFCLLSLCTSLQRKLPHPWILNRV